MKLDVLKRLLGRRETHDRLLELFDVVGNDPELRGVPVRHSDGHHHQAQRRRRESGGSARLPMSVH
jgi:hypothetical protein